MRVLLASIAAVSAASAASAADWSNTITPYLWGTSVQGTMAIGTPLGPIGGGVDMSSGDVFSNLKIGGMLDYRGENDQWAVIADALYADISAHGSKPVGPLTLSVTGSEQLTIVETDVGYKLMPNVLAFAGLRYNDVNLDLSASATGTVVDATGSSSKGQNWVDPVIGISGEFPLSESWSLRLRGDVGGFSVGAKFAWEGVAVVSWQASKSIQVLGGYKYLREEYENGSGTNYFRYDIALQGPALGVAFKF
jgi:opacity protein-like surface antigen